jgi:hypothetical protein
VASSDVRYFINAEEYDKKLMAEVDGQKYLIKPDPSIDSEWESLPYKEIHQVLDLDGDGKLEAIISGIDNGNCCAPAWYIASHRGGSFFTIENKREMYGFEPPSLTKINGVNILIFKPSFDGFYNTSISEKQSLFKFENGRIIQLSTLENSALIPSKIELYSGTLKLVVEEENNLEATISIYADMDLDGKEDEIQCRYWTRWGDLSCTMISTQRGEINMPVACDRYGVLNSISNGMKQLVCDRSTIVSFDGHGSYDDE